MKMRIVERKYTDCFWSRHQRCWWNE